MTIGNRQLIGLLGVPLLLSFQLGLLGNVNHSILYPSRYFFEQLGKPKKPRISLAQRIHLVRSA